MTKRRYFSGLFAKKILSLLPLLEEQIADDSDNDKHVDYPDKGACHAPLQNFQTDIVALEAEIGQLVYALYGLADDEIALVEEKK